MKLISELKNKSPLLSDIAKKHGAYNLRVFGSVARGEETEKSDIDILVTFEKGRTLFDEVRLVEEISILLKHKVDLVGEDAISPSLKSIIMNEAIPI